MIDLGIYHPEELTSEQWLDLRSLSRDSYRHTLDVPDEVIDELVMQNDPDRYIASHLDINSEVDRRLAPDQAYSNPRVVIAREDDQIVGFGFAADNVSWSLRKKLHLPERLLTLDLTFIDDWERQKKQEGIKHHFNYVREVIVNPNRLQRGIGKSILTELTESGNTELPVVTYIWTSLLPFLRDFLTKNGFYVTQTLDLPLVRDDPSSPLQRRSRLEAESGNKVLSKLRPSND